MERGDRNAAGPAAAVAARPRPRLAAPRRRMTRATGWLLGGILLGALLGCDGEAPEARTNLLLVTLDTTRADHTTPYGAARDTTPRLSALAREGVQVDLAYAPTATTAPTHASLFTGLHPLAHGVVQNGVALPDGITTLAERLREAGYQTAGVAGSFVLDHGFGLARGFETWDDAFDPAEASIRTERFGEHEVHGGFDRRAVATSDRALAFLRERDPDRPFFLFLHYFDPHDPYEPVAEWSEHFAPVPGASRVEDAVRRYDVEIAYTDAMLGRVLDALRQQGLERDTLVVVTADHGEGLMEHGWMYHATQIFEEAVRVPLLLRWPGGLPANTRVAGPVALYELPATLLDLLHVDPGAIGGESLAGVLRGEREVDPERPIFLLRQPFEPDPRKPRAPRGEQLGVRVGRFKYVEGDVEDTRELFDLVRDPHERRNLLVDEPATASALAERLVQFDRATRRQRDTGPVSERDRRRLEALGYVQ